MVLDNSTPDPSQLVEAFGSSNERFQIYTALQAIGQDSLPAICEGLQHENWHVRHWCAICLGRQGDAESLQCLLPLLQDPVAKVRLWAVHSISCRQGREFECPFDVVPLLVDRVENDESARVRKMAIAMLAELPPDRRVVPVFKAVLHNPCDAKTRLHAERGLRKYREAGMSGAAEEP